MKDADARSIWASSPRRTFVVIPLAATAWELARRRRPLRGGVLGLALMAAGYGLYRAARRHRNAHGGGGPGSAVPPEHLVTTGPYAVVRNPMYLGHLVFLTGLVALTRSPAALLGLMLQHGRFTERVGRDERRLADRFGHAYVEYVEKVPRWLPRLISSPYVLFHRIAEAESARVRLRVVQLGLKRRIAFLNAETDGKAELARLGGAATPALWDGRRLVSGEDAVERELAVMKGRAGS
jgi:protein-S-isoprenylcysteine O-methyltransferase Ste14